jgi:hypothetical protein
MADHQRMAAAPLKHAADRHRTLRLLADSPEGVTDAVLAAHGVTAGEIAKLVAAGLISTTAQRMGVGRREIAVTRVQITAAGRRALFE